MELTTFGSLLRYAISLERRAGETYGELAARASPPMAEEYLRYVREYSRRLRLLEETQRNINEVLLEPISRLDSDRYAFNVGCVADARAMLDAALDVEAKVEAFYRDSLQAAGTVLGDAGRVFRRLCEENGERRRVLSSMRAS